MGILKVVFFITAPLAGLTIAAFRLGRQLPIAARLFGNYIGLSYVYFKSIITYIKPVDHLPFEMISLARKTSQQSQALKRELRSTLKRVREDLNNKKQETFQQFANKSELNHLKQDFFSEQPINQNKDINRQSEASREVKGSSLILAIMKNRQSLLNLRENKKKSRKFFEQI